MKSSIELSPLLLAISIVSYVGFYSFFAEYQIRHFHPVVDTSAFISDFVSSIRPENEIFLYQVGWVLFFLFVPVLFVIYRKLLGFFPVSTHIAVCHVYLRITGFITIMYLYKLLHGGLFPPLHLLLSYFSIFVGIGFACYLVSWKRPFILTLIQKTLDWILGSVCIFLTLLIVDRLFQAQFEKALVSVFTEYAYSYLERLPALEIAVTLTVLVIFYVLGRKIQTLFASALQSRAFKILFVMVVIGAIAWAVLLLGLPKGYLFNYVAMMAPLNDVLYGKTLLVDSYSHYGLLMIYALVPIFKIIPLSTDTMVYLVTASYIFFYSLIFLIMLSLFKDKLLALFTMYFILLEHYFTVEGTVLCCANISFLRFDWWVILSAWILWKKKIPLVPLLKRILEFSLVAFAVFWSFDTGMYVLLSYIAFLLVSARAEFHPVKSLLKEVFMRITGLFAVITVFFLCISFFLYLQSGRLPDWSGFYGQIGGYVNGLDLLPLPRFGPYQAFIVILILSVGYILYRTYSNTFLRTHNNTQEFFLVTFLTFYALFSLTYYIGRSASGSIHTLMIPFILILGYLILKSVDYILSHGGLKSLTKSSVYAIGGLSVLIMFVSSIIITAGNRNLYNKYQVRDKIMYFPPIDNEPNFHASFAAIQKELEGLSFDKRRITIISTYDILYHVKSPSVNVLDLNILVSVRYKQQLVELGNQLLERKPPVVFAEHNISSVLVYTLINDYLKKLYRNTGRVGNLDRWELIKS